MKRTGLILEGVLLFLLVSGLVYHAGSRSAAAGSVNWDGLSAVAHALDLWYRAPEPRLTEIGFVQPPLPAALASAVVVPRPASPSTLLLPARLGAVFLGLAALCFFLLLRRWGLPRPLGYPLTAAFVLHPVALSLAAGGAPAALLLLLFVGILWGLDEWAATGSLRALLVASLLLGAALLVRYEVAVWVLLIAALVWIVAQRAGGYSQAEGAVLAFLLPLVYLAAGWVVACWLIQGDPWYFWRHTFNQTPPTGAGPLFRAAFGLSLFSCPLLVGGLAYVFSSRHRLRHAQGSLTLLLAGPLLAAGAAPLLGRLSGDAWSQLTVLVIVALAGGYLLFARSLAQALAARRFGAAEVGGLLLAGLGIWVVLGLTNSGVGLPARTVSALSGRLAFTGDCRGEGQAAALLAGERREGERVVVAGWPGFAVAALEGSLEAITCLPSATPPATPVPPFEVLLVRENKPGVLQAAWEAAASSPLRLVWRTGLWTCYRPAHP